MQALPGSMIISVLCCLCSGYASKLSINGPHTRLFEVVKFLSAPPHDAGGVDWQITRMAP
jgi:hypothetical protein